MPKYRFGEGSDYSTYKDHANGWRWLCLHTHPAGDESGRGWSWARVDARKDARAHCEKAGHEPVKLASAT